MTIGFADGTQYESMYHLQTDQPVKTEDDPANTQLDKDYKDLFDHPLVQQRKLWDIEERLPKDWDSNKGEEGKINKPGDLQIDPTRGGTQLRVLPTVDRGHHVPLVASALVDEEGNMNGMAMDHRIPPHPEYDQFIHLHESSELPHMQNLMIAGMSEQDAYHEAHDKIATPTETAAVRAYAVSHNKDPDKYLDDYKQHWRDMAAISRTNSDRERHPDAHTTKFHLDEHELPGSKEVTTPSGKRFLIPPPEGVEDENYMAHSEKE